MILSDREIRAALARGSLRITPDPRTEVALWSSTALDLKLDGQLSRWSLPPAALQDVCPAEPDFDYHTLSSQYLSPFPMPEGGYPMAPGEFLLGWTLERLQMPHTSRLAARVEGKSSLARLGLGVHVTAPTIHAGFGYKANMPEYIGSSIQLEIWNVGPARIVLKAGMRICQLIFETVDGTPELGYEGTFTIQGPSQGLLPSSP